MKSYSNIASIMAFLRRLAVNNDRQWFKEHKDEYDALRKPWEQDIERLIGLVSQFDPSIRGLDVKNAVYRIYRDIRFSHDKSPYKTYFSAVLAQGGRHGRKSGYYLHLQPDNCLLCGGVWCPDKDKLTQLRSLIDAERDEFGKIISNPSFTRLYKWNSSSLKKVPKGYSEDDPMAYYLKMKEFLVNYTVPESFFDCDDWVERTAASFKPLLPLHQFLDYVYDDDGE